MKLLIKGGRIVDPVNSVDKVMDLLVERGKIVRLNRDIKSDGAKVIDARGMVVMPGLIDMHVHLREPGREDKETILTGSRAAAKGGFTAVCPMANTDPVVDKEGQVEFILSRGRSAGLIDILPIGAVTKGQKGEELAEIGELKRAGVVGLSDDGNPIRDSHVMRKALEYSKMFDLPIIAHCEDLDLSADGVMNEGYISTVLGLRGIPSLSEEAMVARDISLARMTGGRLHIAHVSTAGSVELIRRAKQKGDRVTCETAPHYFSLTDEALKTFDTNYKMKPPLRTAEDVKAIKEGLKDGTIDCIATDHAPHTVEEKDVEFDRASFGVIGLETSLALAITELVDKGIFTLSQLVRCMSCNPAQILGLDKGTLSPGKDADITVVDLNREWQVLSDEFESKSRNSPFIGWKLKGKVVATIHEGKVVFDLTK